MKGMDYMKKKLSLFLAFAVAVTALWGLPVFADGTDGYIAKIGETYYPSIRAAVENSKNGDVIQPANPSVVITTGEKAELKAPVTIDGFTFGDGGYLSLAGSFDFALINCRFTAQKTYAESGNLTPVNLAVKGKLTISGNDFSGAVDNAYYNCIETGLNGAYEVQNGSVISANSFGVIGGSAVTIHSVAEGATVAVSQNTFKKSANAICLGNTKYLLTNAVFNLTDNRDGNASDFVILRDNGTTAETHEIFSGYALNFVNHRYGAEGTVALSNEPRQYSVNNMGVVNPVLNMPTASFGVQASPSPLPTGITETPTAEPTGEPTVEPTEEPTTVPTVEPTKDPTAEPTKEPTVEPTEEPTGEPTATPSTEPTSEPTVTPTTEPTVEPTVTPTADPNATPTPMRSVTVQAGENITSVTLINKDTNTVIELAKDEGAETFSGTAADGEYEIVWTTAEGTEVDLVKSDLGISIKEDNASAALYTQAANEVDHIALVTPPAKTVYAVGETFDPTGMVIRVVNNDGTAYDAAYDDTTKADFTFKPGLDTPLPHTSLYMGERNVTVIYKNRLLKQELEFVMSSASATLTYPSPHTRVGFEAALPEGAHYTAGTVTWDPAVYPGSNYNYGTTYTAYVTLTADDGYYFGENTEALINDRVAVTEVSSDRKTLNLSYTFPRTSIITGGDFSSDFSTGVGATATPKPDLNTYDHFAYMVGYPDGYIRPENNITRDEVATIFFRLLTDQSRSRYWSQVNYYVDVPPELWSNNAISTLTKAGILGGDGTAYFRPEDYITRAEFATIAAKFSSIVYSSTSKFGDVGGHWSEDYVNIAAEEGWIQGYEDGTFRPDQLITRAEAMTLVNNVLNRHVRTSGLLSGMKTWRDNRDANEWYYTAVQEATNTHDYTRAANGKYETWTKIGDNPDWTKLEQQWSSAGSAGAIN